MGQLGRWDRRRLVNLALTWLPRGLLAGLMVAALGWCLAFGLYLLRYGPMLVRVRADGKPG